jgi:hypothetical protein
MKKIKLELENLHIESFSTEPNAETTGTVVAFETGVADCGWSFVDPRQTCGGTVWEAGCSFVTAPLDCGPTEGGYAWCQHPM